jgi:hypothetical protein
VQVSDNPGADTPRASRQGSDNPPVARTGSDNPGSDNPRAARHGTRATVQGSDNPGADTPHTSRHGSLNPPVVGTGSDNPGSDNPRVASLRTNGSSVSVLPQAPEASDVAEYIVLAEVVAQDGIDPTRLRDPLSTVPSAIEARPVAVAVVAQPLATAASGASSSSQRPPVRWGAGIPIGPQTTRVYSSRLSLTRTPEARAGGPITLVEFTNGDLSDVDVDAEREPKRRKLIHHDSRRVTGRAAADQELIDKLSTELTSAMRQLQQANAIGM